MCFCLMDTCACSAELLVYTIATCNQDSNNHKLGEDLKEFTEVPRGAFSTLGMPGLLVFLQTKHRGLSLSLVDKQICTAWLSNCFRRTINSGNGCDASSSCSMYVVDADHSRSSAGFNNS